jgi:surfeit locus 1 family protein
VWSVARRPQWIGALVLALVIAAGFAALGQWQISRSIIDATVVERDTETVVTLESLVEPGSSTTEKIAGHMVSFDGTLVSGDSSVLSDRINGSETGYWVMGHVVTSTGASVAVALGWSPTKEGADAAAEPAMGITALVPYVGRYLGTESPQDSDFENGERNTAAVAALINEWTTAPTAVYGGYVVSADPLPGLEPIVSPAPEDEVTVNWLNIFYAVEWVVFAVFAVFLWFRLVRDAWEREVEFAAEDAAEAAAAEAAADGDRADAPATERADVN